MPIEGDPDLLICTTSAAKFWRCDTEAVRKGIKQGIIRAVKAPDGYLWIPRSELFRIKILPPGYPQRCRVRPDYDGPDPKRPLPGEGSIHERAVDQQHQELDRGWSQKMADRAAEPKPVYATSGAPPDDPDDPFRD